MYDKLESLRFSHNSNLKTYSSKNVQQEWGHLHLIYQQGVYKRDSYVCLDGRQFFSSHEAIFVINMEITWKSQQLHKAISVIKGHVNDQNV